MNKKQKVYVKVIPDTSEIDEVLAKAQKLTDYLEKAMELSNSIANSDLNIRISTEINDKSTELASITTV